MAKRRARRTPCLSSIMRGPSVRAADSRRLLGDAVKAGTEKRRERPKRPQAALLLWSNRGSATTRADRRRALLRGTRSGAARSTSPCPLTAERTERRGRSESGDEGAERRARAGKSPPQWGPERLRAGLSLSVRPDNALRCTCTAICDLSHGVSMECSLVCPAEPPPSIRREAWIRKSRR